MLISIHSFCQTFVHTQRCADQKQNSNNALAAHSTERYRQLDAALDYIRVVCVITIIRFTIACRRVPYI